MPTRYLKPGIRGSERIEAVTIPDAEILYYRLLVTVDDFGRTDARPAMLKAACFPIRRRATEDKCMQWMQDLERSGLLFTYEVDGKPYLQITKWENKARSQLSKFPNPPANTDIPRTVADIPRASLPGTGTGTGTENREPNVAPSAKPLEACEPVNGFCYIPLADKSEFAVTAELVAEFEKAYPSVDLPQTFREIRAWCVTNPTKCKTKSGVKRFLNRWLAKEQNHG